MTVIVLNCAKTRALDKESVNTVERLCEYFQLQLLTVLRAVRVTAHCPKLNMIEEKWSHWQ